MTGNSMSTVSPPRPRPDFVDEVDVAVDRVVGGDATALSSGDEFSEFRGHHTQFLGRVVGRWAGVCWRCVVLGAPLHTAMILHGLGADSGDIVYIPSSRARRSSEVARTAMARSPTRTEWIHVVSLDLPTRSRFAGSVRNHGREQGADVGQFVWCWAGVDGCVSHRCGPLRVARF